MHRPISLTVAALAARGHRVHVLLNGLLLWCEVPFFVLTGANGISIWNLVSSFTCVRLSCLLTIFCPFSRIFIASCVFALGFARCISSLAQQRTELLPQTGGSMLCHKQATNKQEDQCLRPCVFHDQAEEHKPNLMWV